MAESVEQEKRFAKADNRAFDAVRVLANHKPPQSEDTPFVQFAKRLFEVSCNSASCERLFSVFGNILTKHRTLMGTETLELLAEIKMLLRDELARSGEEKKRLKKQFDMAKAARAERLARERGETSNATGPGPATESQSAAAASEARAEARASLRTWIESEFLEGDDDDESVRPDTELSFPIALDDLFDFSGTFWINKYEASAKQGLQDELDIFEWLDIDAEAEDEEDDDEREDYIF